MNSIKVYIGKQISELKSSLKKSEYISWWAVRALMAAAIFYSLIKRRDSFVILMLSLNLLACFSVPLARILFPSKIILGRTPFRVQTYINIIVFAGSFMGHGFGLNGSVENFDKLLHVLSGGVCVFIAASLIDEMKGGRKSPVIFKTITASGFSCIVMVAWEIFEFFADFYIEGSVNQNYAWTPDRGMFFFRIFGYGTDNAGQYPVFDTNIDFLCSLMGCIAADILLFIILKKKEKQTN